MWSCRSYSPSRKNAVTNLWTFSVGDLSIFVAGNNVAGHTRNICRLTHTPPNFIMTTNCPPSHRSFAVIDIKVIAMCYQRIWENEWHPAGRVIHSPPMILGATNHAWIKCTMPCYSTMQYEASIIFTKLTNHAPQKTPSSLDMRRVMPERFNNFRNSENIGQFMCIRAPHKW